MDISLSFVVHCVSLNGCDITAYDNYDDAIAFFAKFISQCSNVTIEVENSSMEKIFNYLVNPDVAWQLLRLCRHLTGIVILAAVNKGGSLYVKGIDGQGIIDKV